MDGKTIAEFLSDHFRPRKYDAAADLSPLQWWDLLFWRRSLYHECTKLGGGNDKEYWLRARDTIVSNMSNPFVPLDFEEGDLCGSSAVTDYSQDTPYEQEEFIVTASVDLAATDDVLIAVFKHWLRAKRLERSATTNPNLTKKIRPKLLQSWSEHRVLGFIDLVCAEALYNTKLPYHAKGRELFPEEANVDVAERVRKVIKPEAEIILTDESLLNALYHYALHTAAGSDSS